MKEKKTMKMSSKYSERGRFLGGQKPKLLFQFQKPPGLFLGTIRYLDLFGETQLTYAEMLLAENFLILDFSNFNKPYQH